MLVLVASAFAAPLNLFGGMTEGGTGALAPTVFVDGAGATPLLYGTLGVASVADLSVGVGATSDWQGQAGPGAVDAMARVAVAGDLVLGLHAGATFGDPELVVGPELHWGTSVGSVDITANAGWRASTSTGASTVSAGVAPELWFGAGCRRMSRSTPRSSSRRDRPPRSTCRSSRVCPST